MDAGNRCVRKNRFHAPVGAHAGANFVGMALLGLAHPESIGNQRPRHADKIAIARTQNGFSLVRRGDTAHAHHRQIDTGLDLARSGHLKAVLFRRGRVDHHAVQVSALRAGNVIKLAGGSQVFGNLGPLHRTQAALHAVVAVQTQADDGVRPHFFARGVDDAHDDAHAVLQ